MRKEYLEECAESVINGVPKDGTQVIDTYKNLYFLETGGQYFVAKHEIETKWFGFKVIDHYPVVELDTDLYSSSDKRFVHVKYLNYNE